MPKVVVISPYAIAQCFNWAAQVPTDEEPNPELIRQRVVDMSKDAFKIFFVVGHRPIAAFRNSVRQVQKKAAKQFMQRVRVDAKSLGFTDVHCTILIASPGAGHAAVGRLVQ